MKKFAKYFANNLADLWLLLLVILGSGLAVGGLFAWQGGIEAGLQVGFLVAAFAGALMLLAVNSAHFWLHFPMGVHMGATRRHMLASLLAQNAIYSVVCMGLPLLGMAVTNGVLHGRFLPTFMLGGFAIPVWVWGVCLLATVLVPVGISMTLIVFGRKGFWVLWAVYMVLVLGISHNAISLEVSQWVLVGICAAVVMVGWVIWSLWKSLRCAIQ